MGFNKRVISKEHILKHLHHIMDYLDADAVFTTDDFSRAVYRLYNSGVNQETIINYINQNK